MGAHASNLGAPLAVRLAAEGGCRKAFIVDPVVVDELGPLARYSGLPEIERRSIFHALNQKSVGRRAASDLGNPMNSAISSWPTWEEASPSGPTITDGLPT